MRRNTPTAVRLVEIGLGTVFFAVPSSVLTGAIGPYDEPKAWSLVVGVGLTGLAWLAARLFGSEPMPVRPDALLRAVRWTVVAYGAWWSIATALSMAPGQSLWGGFGRAFGLVVFLAVLALFGIVQAEVRTLDRACHLIDLALIGSIPVVALALGQALGWDPLPPGWDPATADLRVRSTFGQHIFLGSYLVALIPLGVGRLITARQQQDRLSPIHAAVASLWALGVIGVLGAAPHAMPAWWLILAWSAAGATAWSVLIPASRRSLPAPWRIAVLVTLLTVQACALVLSTARGALIGVVAGLLAASGVLLAARRAKRAIAILGVCALMLVLFVGALNFGVSPDRLKGVPVLARLGSIAASREGSPGWVRLRLWEGILSGWRGYLSADETLEPSPLLRAMIGYGPETQMLILDRFLPVRLRSITTHYQDWRARYMFDRAHNEPLDHLVTTGVIGMLLWLGLVVTLVVAGVIRLRSASGTTEAGVRLGCLAVVVGQVVEGLVGIATPMPRALFWVAAAILTIPSPLPRSPEEQLPESRIHLRAARVRRALLPSLALLAIALALVLVATVATTRSLLGSMAYAAGIRRGIAGDLPAARRDFVRASHLAPWTPFPAEAAADVSLRMASTDPTRPADGLEEAQEVLDRARRYAPRHSNLWLLGGRVALARASRGHLDQLGVARRDFSEAGRLRPGDPIILSQWAFALAQSGDPVGARRLAEEAVTGDRTAWLAWAVLARSHGQLGNVAQAQRSAEEARRSVPSTYRALLEQLLP